MNVKIMKPYGFCAGVEYVLRMIQQVIEDHKEENIYCIGQIVHNKSVNEEIRNQGIIVLEGNKEEIVEKIRKGVVVFSAHGTSKKVIQRAKEKGLIVYDDPDYKVFRSELYALSPDTFDNISYRWLPENIHDSRGGSHNGQNYLAYTFYVENQGKDTADYYSEIEIVDVIKNVDEAVRIRVYKNDVQTTYAKKSARNEPEKNTTPFLEDKLIALDHVENFKPGDIDKYTVVLWLEGSDPECNDNILGGEIKIVMSFNSEYVDD